MRCVPVSLKNRMVPSSAVSVQMLERSYEKAPRHMSPSWSDDTLPCMALEKRRREIFSAPFSELPVGFPSATWQTCNTSGHLDDCSFKGGDLGWRTTLATLTSESFSRVRGCSASPAASVKSALYGSGIERLCAPL